MKPNYSTDPKPAKPPIHTDVYGTKAPKAAQAGVGATNLAEIREAPDARRNARPGQYDR
jgi:hypothetical protein